jgi:hypothetical protein
MTTDMPANPDLAALHDATANAIADLVKYRYFTINKELAGLQLYMAELTAAGRLDPKVNEHLQMYFTAIYDQLLCGLLLKVSNAVDDGKALEDTYSDGSPVVVKEQQYAREGDWPNVEFLNVDASIVEFPPGCKSAINLPPGAGVRSR